jgi:hypothetical protein
MKIKNKHSKRPLKDLPKDVNAFLERLIAFETAPDTTNFQQLLNAGVELPSPETLGDDQVSRKLWEVIGALAQLRVFLSQTDHLSDRQLYELLWREILRHEIPDVPPEPTSAWHVDLLTGGGEDETRLYMKYYADERDRRAWLADFPDYDMPSHEDPPYDRDRRLPVPQY